MIDLNTIRKSFFLFTILAGTVFFSCEEEVQVETECGDISFTISKDESTNSYTFELDSSDVFSDIVWTINGDTAALVSGETGEVFTIQLQEGSNEICVSGFSTECLDTLGFCATVEVEASGEEEEEEEEEKEDECPTVEFGIAELGDNRFQFELANTDATSVYWKVDGEVVNQGDEAIEYSLDPGQREICVVATFEGCETDVIACQTIVVEGTPVDDCPEIEVEKSYKEATGEYKFELEASIDVQPTSIEWIVNDEVLSTSGTEFIKSFTAGSYTVCAVATFDGCESAKEACVEFMVSDCPDMFFAYQETGNPREYHFAADFEGIENLEWYGWYIDGVEVEAEGTLNTGDNQLIYTFPEAGTYNVCILTETPECPQGVEFCKEIVVE